MPTVFYGLNDSNLIIFHMSLATSCITRTILNEVHPLGAHFGVLEPDCRSLARDYNLALFFALRVVASYGDSNVEASHVVVLSFIKTRIQMIYMGDMKRTDIIQ
jgi:hypothetical protein